MKKLLIIFVLGFVALSFGAFAQITIDSSGNVGIKTAGTLTSNFTVNGDVRLIAPNSGVALRTTVNNQNDSSYNLWNNYYNQDVFYVHGTGFLWCKLGGYFGSDINMKQDIKEIESPLSLVTKLHGVKYKYKDDKELDQSKLEERMGLIAQEVEKIVPQVVKEMNDGTKAIAYTDLIGLLVEAMKEQQVQIEELKKLINEK